MRHAPIIYNSVKIVTILIQHDLNFQTGEYGQPRFVFYNKTIDGIITRVDVLNAPGSGAIIGIFAAGPGTNHLRMGALSEISKAILVQLEIYALPLNTTGTTL